MIDKASEVSTKVDIPKEFKLNTYWSLSIRRFHVQHNNGDKDHHFVGEPLNSHQMNCLTFPWTSSTVRLPFFFPNQQNLLFWLLFSECV